MLENFKLTGPEIDVFSFLPYFQTGDTVKMFDASNVIS